MKALISMAVLSASVLALGACATTAEEDTSTGYAPQQHESLIGDNEAYMATVEAMARQRGIEVYWVNPPPKPRSALIATTDD